MRFWTCSGWSHENAGNLSFLLFFKWCRMQGESWNVLSYVHGMPLSVGNLNELDVYKNTLKKMQN